MEQLVARWAHNPEAAGSSPAPATEKEERDVVVPKGTAAFFFCLHSPIGLAVSKVFNNFLFTYSGRFNIIEHESHSPSLITLVLERLQEQWQEQKVYTFPPREGFELL